MKIKKAKSAGLILACIAATRIASEADAGDFDATYDDILRGCRGLLAYISGGI